MRESICHSMSMVLDTYILVKTISPIFTPVDTPLVWVRPRAIRHHHHLRSAGKNKSRAQAPHRINSGGVQENAKTNPSSRRDEDASTRTQTQKCRLSTSTHLLNLPTRSSRRKHWKGRKWEESTTLVTNQHINLSPSPPSNSHKQRVQSIQKDPDVGRWVEWERERRGE
jgi:hypothetical protein